MCGGMKTEVIQRLNAINRQFYETIAQSFDETRGKPWPGWDHLLPHLKALSVEPLEVLDVGCGNGRFGLFLAENLPYPVRYTGIDNNQHLLDAAAASLKATPNITAALHRHDVVESVPDSGLYDLVGVFGLIHHIPGYSNRQHFVYKLSEWLKPGGILALACWRFYDYERFRARIVPWPDDLTGEVEPHDYLLDWRRGEVALRYCHHVDDAELSDLIAITRLEEIETFSADGFSGAVNRYCLLKKP